MKTCTKCGQEKTLDGFSRHKGRADGHETRCRGCVNAKNRAYYLANKEKLNALSREYRLANTNKIATRKREYQLANKDKAAAQKREWQQVNREGVVRASRAMQDRYKRETLPTATRHRAKWEPWEEAAVMDYARTAKETALMLMRTHSSVSARRRNLTKRFMNTDTD